MFLEGGNSKIPDLFYVFVVVSNKSGILIVVFNL